MHFSEPYVNAFVINKVMEPQEKEDIRLSSNLENENMFGNLSALKFFTTLEKSNKNSIDNYLKEMSYSKKEALYYALSKMNKNLDE